MSDALLNAQPTKTFAQHLSATLFLGIPLVLAQLAQMLINVTDTIMLGWLGTKELAAGTLAFQAFFIFLIFGLGFGAAMIPIIANALGRGDPRSVRRAGRMGLWALLLLSFVFMVPLWFTGDLLIALGQEKQLADLAERYMHIAQWSMIPVFMVVGLKSFLTSLEKANAILIITLLTAVVNGLLNYALIFGNWGAPALGIEGAAVATVISNTLSAILAFFYVKLSPAARPYDLFARIWRPDWPAFFDISRLGVPISLSIFAEAGMFSAASIMIGWIGTVHLAAHGIALQLASLTFMLPLGFSQAASVRVGNAAGRGDKIAITRAANAVVLIALACAASCALMFLIVPEYLINLFIDDANVDADDLIRFAVPLLYMAAAFQIFDTLQVAYAGSLRGLQDTKVPMFIAIVSYWFVGMISAYTLAFPLGYGSAGIWGGLVVGLAVAGLALSLRFNKREQLGLI